MNMPFALVVICLALLLLVVGGTVALVRQSMLGIMRGFLLSLKAAILLALILSQHQEVLNRTLLLVALSATCLLPLMLSIFFTLYLRLIRFNGSANLDFENSLRQ